MKRGIFITVEGIEGVGKSTNIDVLVRQIAAAGHTVVTTREPGGTPVAEKIRKLLKDHGDEPIPEIAELLMMFAARSLNVNNVIVPALEAGKWVISDRFTDSSRAYQGGGRGLPMETINQLADWVHGDTQPDLTILLDAPPEIGMARASSRSSPDRIEMEKLEFFARVRECYLELAAAEPDRFVVIDTCRSMDDVEADIIALAQQILCST
ncbi:MAG TPA: dTMP kinase [Woeseiaceae bacterium]|nr:dTMP kinase [Woeseiaceae bacterium]